MNGKLHDNSQVACYPLANDDNGTEKLDLSKIPFLHSPPRLLLSPAASPVSSGIRSRSVWQCTRLGLGFHSQYGLEPSLTRFLSWLDQASGRVE